MAAIRETFGAAGRKAASQPAFMMAPSMASRWAPAEPAALDLNGGSQKVTFHYFPDQCHVLSRQAHAALRKDWLDFLRQSLGT